METQVNDNESFDSVYVFDCKRCLYLGITSLQSSLLILLVRRHQ
jgi:hypothetical protein